MIQNKDALTKPFPRKLHMQKPGRGNLTYVEWVHYAHRLNAAFGHDGWSFEIREHTVTDKQAVVLGVLNACGVVKEAFGGSEVGREVRDVADALKAAQSDALRKAASLFGIGLELWSEKREAPSQERPQQARSNGGGQARAPGPDRVVATHEQVLELARKAGVKREVLEAECRRANGGVGFEALGIESLGAIAQRLTRKIRKQGGPLPEEAA